MNTEFINQKFDSIQALRGIAAIFVALSHLSFVGVGAFGVDIFFCISGFIMMYVTEKGGKNFLLKRIIRIVPLYYLLTVFTYLALYFLPRMFETTTARVSYLFQSFFFIPYEIEGVIQPIVRVGWTINYEMFFYVLFFISMKISHKYRGLLCSVLLLLLAAAGEFFQLPGTILKFWCSELLIEFIFGILSFYICRKLYTLIRDEKAGKYRMFLGISSVFVLLIGFGMLIAEKNITEGVLFHRVINQGIWGFLIFLAVFVTGCIIKLPKWLCYLGDISFSVYLLHYYPIMFLSRFLERYDSLFIKWIAGIFGIILVIGISSVSYYLIEKKISHFLRKKLIKNSRLRNEIH